MCIEYKKIKDNEIVLNMQINRCKWIFENINVELTENKYLVAQRFIHDDLCCPLSLDIIKKIFILYPEARIKLAEFGILDTETKDEICNSISLFFIGCEWPTHGDKIDIYEFEKLLKRQVQLFKMEK